MYQPIPPRSPLETMPTMYDLPSELVGESGLPDEFHCMQAALLTETCQLVDYLPEEILLASDLNLYYDPRHPNWYKRPDWYRTAILIMTFDLLKPSNFERRHRLFKDRYCE